MEEAMEREKMLEILKALADGIDPATGEQFAAQSPYQHPDTVRALYSAIRTLENPAAPPAKTSAPATRPGPENAGRPWSDEEDVRLARSFDSGKPVEELAQLHKRSKWAIESRLARLGKIEPPPSRFAPRPPAGKTALNATA
jgi:hypothetical protein